MVIEVTDNLPMKKYCRNTHYSNNLKIKGFRSQIEDRKSNAKPMDVRVDLKLFNVRL